MPVPIDPELSPDHADDEQTINIIRPGDAFGATPRWVVPDQEPVSRFEGGVER